MLVVTYGLNMKSPLSTHNLYSRGEAVNPTCLWAYRCKEDNRCLQFESGWEDTSSNYMGSIIYHD